MDMKHCAGCHDNFYNQRDGKCWSLDSAKLIKRRRVHVNDRPPWANKPETLPDCYHRPQYIFVKPNQTCQ